MLQDELGVRAALAAPPFSVFCALKGDEPPRRGSLAALCGGDPAQRPAATPAFEQQYRSRIPKLPTTVEAYGRSAAGVVVEPSHLRTPMALEKSMHFLVHHYLREPHTPALFLAPFDVWRHLWDRMRQVRTNWVPQLPPVGTESFYDSTCKGNAGEHDGNSPDDVLLRNIKESKRRLRWLEFTVAALALGGANLCRTTQGCRRYMEEKQNFLESIAQCFGDLVLSYRAEQRLRNSEMFSALILFYGLSQLTKIENRSGFCRLMEVTLAGDAAPTHIFEPPNSSVDFVSVYRELACLPQMVHTRHVRTALQLIHCWCQRAWFRFFYLCRTARLTVLQRAMVFHSFAYARFRAVVDLVTANALVYSKVRVRGEMTVKQLAELLLMEPAHCVELLETMGLNAQMSDDRSVLYLARHDSSPYTTQEAIYKHLEDTGGKQRLCLPTFPSFFGFKVWRQAFDLFPDALADNAETADLRSMTCPVNLMELLEPYCPPYNEDVAALALRDAGNEWFNNVQEARERMLWKCVTRNLRRRDVKVGEDVDMDDSNDNYNDYNNDGGMSYGSDQSDVEELDEEEGEARWAAVAALDRESKSTSSSIFSDYDDDMKPLGEWNEAEMETTDLGWNPEEEENKVLHNATTLIQSLQNDRMYAKVREGSMQEAKRGKSLSKETDEEDRTRTPSSSSSSVRNEVEGEGEENNNNKQQPQPQSSIPWLTLSAPKLDVVVTPLPNDYPAKMSPSLQATVETPQSVTAASAVDEEFKEVEEVREEEEGEEEEEENSGTESISNQLPIENRTTRSEKMTKPSLSFPGVFPRKPMTFPPEPPQSFQPEPQKKRTRGEMEGGSDEIVSRIKRVMAEPTHDRNHPHFFAPRQEKEQAGQQLDLNSSRTDSVSSRIMLLPFEKEQEQRSDYDEDDGGEEECTLPRRRMRLEQSTTRTKAEMTTTMFSRHLPLEKEEGNQQTCDTQGMRRVSFAASSSKASQPPPLQALPLPPKTVDVAKAEAVTGRNSKGMTYQEVIKAYMKKNRGASRGFTTTPLSIDSDSLLCSSSFLSGVRNPVDEDAPQWMCTFVNYLLRFFTASYSDSLACKFLSEVICGDPDAQTRKLAGWLCRGFTPTIRSYPWQQQLLPSVFGSTSPQLVKTPTLCLNSTVIVFGSGIRDEDEDDNDNDVDTSVSSLHRSVVRPTLEEKALSELLSLVSESADGDIPPRTTTVPTAGVRSVMRHSSLGRWVAALLLSKRDGACLLASGGVYGAGREDMDNSVDGSKEDHEESLCTSERIGLWEQLHGLRMVNCGSSTQMGLDWVQPAAMQAVATPAGAALWRSSRSREVMVQTQLALYAVDFRDVTHLHWVSTEKNDLNSTKERKAHSSVEHLTAIVTLDARRQTEYEAGLHTLKLLVQQAVEQQTVFLAGVLVVLHTCSAEKDVELQERVEEFFWDTWKQCMHNVEAARRRAATTGEKEIPPWRRAYQETIRRTVASTKQLEQEKEEDVNKHLMRTTALLPSTRLSLPNRKTHSSSRIVKKHRGFFSSRDVGDDRNTARASEMLSCDATQTQVPIPAFLITPICTAVKEGRDITRMGTNSNKSSYVYTNSNNNNSFGNGGDFITVNAEVLRVALQRAVSELLNDYETQWRAFLQNQQQGVVVGGGTTTNEVYSEKWVRA